MNTTLNSLWTILIATALIGCAEIDSEHLRTSGFHADITVTANDDSTIVSTRLNTSNAIDADHINLTAGDQLTASIPGRSIVLHQRVSSYSATFDGSNENTEINVSLNRLNDKDAPNSRVVVPEQFELAAPDSGETFYDGDNLTFVWSPSDPTTSVTVTLSIDCQVFDENGIPSGSRFGRGVSVPNTGIHTVSINELLNSYGGGLDQLSAPGSCSMEATVKRVNEGTLDRALMQGGRIRASREKSVLVRFIPQLPGGQS